MDINKTILITGASGYIGSRLATRLLYAGYKVRCMVRNKNKLFLSSHTNLEVVEADVFDRESLDRALDGISVAYYLIHALYSGEESFENLERTAANNFSRAAENAGIERIVYLGGLGKKDDELSPHLRSRQRTGHLLREGKVPVIEFRAGSIIGSGSLAFEILRYLTERLPIIIAPKWVNTMTHPIGIREVLDYLVAAATNEKALGRIYEIGGAQKLSYANLMMTFAELRELKRFIIKVPLLTPSLSAMWISVVTPLPSQVAGLLIEGLKNEISADTTQAVKDFGIKPVALKTTLKRAIRASKKWVLESENIPLALKRISKDDGKREIVHSRGFIVEKFYRETDSSAENLFNIIKKIGGENGWPYARFLWKLRFLIDPIMGGEARAYRRDYENLKTGDQLDFWRVVRYEENRCLFLRNRHMGIPGGAWLRFNIKPGEKKKSRLEMVVYYQPRGFFGIFYWYIMLPAHKIIFRGMLNKIREQAEELD